MKVERMNWITRADLQANPDKAFLFGDNLERVGMGGQAGAMRGEPNAVGIPTKVSPSMDEKAFFSDDQFDRNCLVIVAALRGVKHFETVVIPADGLGTGLAELDKRAPRTFAYLEQKLAELEK